MNKFFSKVVVLSVILLETSVAYSQNIKPFSAIKYKSITKVSLSSYKSSQLRDNQIPSLALGVSISGGGSRAEYFGLGVLLELEEIKVSKYPGHDFLHEIDYFSTVSGGCYAAGYYLTVQKNLLKNSMSFNDFFFSKGSKYEDYVGEKANKGRAFRNKRYETIGPNYPMAMRLDYEILQYDSTDTKQERKFSSQMKMSDFFIPYDSKLTPTLPMFVPNGTIYNNAERLPFMPHILHDLKITSSLIPNEATLTKQRDGINDGYDFPLTYAITASSAFPGVLPKVKFAIKDTSKILCVVDGGIADNLGYNTLLELLNSDAYVSNKSNKKSLIIDCSGDGIQGQLIEPEKIGLLSLIEKGLLYTVESKYIYYNEDIYIKMKAYGMNTNNNVIVGFSTILNALPNMPDDAAYNNLKKALTSTKDEDKYWYPFYTDFRDNLISRFGENAFKKDEDDKPILSSLLTNNFQKLTKADVFILFEYAAQVETKLMIYPDERDMLLLAGRYATYLKTQDLQSLLTVSK